MDLTNYNKITATKQMVFEYTRKGEKWVLPSSLDYTDAEMVLKINQLAALGYKIEMQ